VETFCILSAECHLVGRVLARDNLMNLMVPYTALA